MRASLRQKMLLGEDKVFWTPYIWLRDILPSIPQLAENWQSLYPQLRELSILRNKLIHGRMELGTAVAEEVIDKAAQVLTGIAELRTKVDSLSE